MAEQPKLVTDKIRDEAAAMEAAGDTSGAAAMRQVADEMDNTKNGSVNGPKR